MSIYNNLNKKLLPKHIAIIMDGNGRWAKELGKNRYYGHVQGIKSIKKTVDAIIKLKIPYLTLFAFSKENWNRPKKEVNLLMNLFMSTIIENQDHFYNKKIKITTIGELNDLPKQCQKALIEMMNKTKNNAVLNLTLALSYSSRTEITQAVQKMLNEEKPKNSAEISEALLSSYLQTNGMPDPELLIRTSGEKRVSNFLLWQIAFSELYFSEKKWPDFNEEELYMAIFEFQKRERRFGKTTDQLKNEIN